MPSYFPTPFLPTPVHCYGAQICCCAFPCPSRSPPFSHGAHLVLLSSYFKMLATNDLLVCNHADLSPFWRRFSFGGVPSSPPPLCVAFNVVTHERIPCDILTFWECGGFKSFPLGSADKSPFSPDPLVPLEFITLDLFNEVFQAWGRDFLHFLSCSP